MSHSNLLRFIFFGEDVFSLTVLESLVNSNLNLKPLNVVMLNPISTSGKRLVKYCQNNNISILQTESVKSEEFLKNFDGLSFDLIISAHFQRILPEKLFKKANLGGINLHPSLLPKYRGMSPQHWPIIYGDSNTGVTVHLIDEGVDTGNILCQELISLSPDIYIHEFQKKLLSVYKRIVVNAVKRLINGDRGTVQPSLKLPYFGKIKDEDMVIHVNTPIDRAYGMVRAFSFPYQGARFGNIRIMKAVPASSDIIDFFKNSKAAFDIHERNSSFYLVLKDGALELIKWNKI